MIRQITFSSLFCLFFITLHSCSNKKQKSESINQTLFTLLPSDSTGVDFYNKIVNNNELNIFKYRNFYNGGGVAIGDINNDSLPDLYFTANMGPNKLYLNKGDFKFEDITEKAGVAGNKPWSTGVLMADVNGDGLLDIYVSNAGNLKGNNHDNDLYINNGNLTFTESAKEFNLATSGFSTHATFFDFDKDGDLDCYILNNSNIPVTSLGYAHQRDKRAQDWENVPYIFRGVGDMLLENKNGKFEDISEKAGIYGSLIGFGLGVMISDFNEDSYPDIYVSNDFYERDYLYINNQDGTFTEDIKNRTSHLCLSAMGIDIGDINNDGKQDIFITDMLPEGDQRTKEVMVFDSYNVFKLKQSKDFFQQYIHNTLQLNNGNGTYSDIANFSGVAMTDWSWAGLFFDMNNDRKKDLYVTNGVNHDMTDLDFVDFFANEIIQDLVLTGKKESIDSIIHKMPRNPQPNYAYLNNGNLTFTNKAMEWGLGTPSFSNGAAYGDLDNDGDLDLVVNNVNSPSFLYKNNANDQTQNNYLKINLKGKKPNTFAIGSKITIFIDDEILVHEQIPSRGFQSSMDYELVFGLGEKKKVDSLKIKWPDGKILKQNNVSANQTLYINQNKEEGNLFKAKQKFGKTWLKEIPNKNLKQHKENIYSDFNIEGTLAEMLSQEGPALAIGDVNADGHEDVFVGGGKNQEGILYIHSGNGNLRNSNNAIWKQDSSYEDTAAKFFDSDGDGDLDLLVGSGGNEYEQQEIYGLRLYENDGNGNFRKSPQTFTQIKHNIAVIATSDFDDDGDEDIFVGSRSVVGNYGLNPKHFLLINKGDNIFEDLTERKAYDVTKAGMITDAVWADYDGDGIKDLICTTDWGAVQIFKNNGRQLNKQQNDLDNYLGQWKTINVEDLDKDGDMDFILGNVGNNTVYKTSNRAPMKLWINDFDQNGSIDKIITRFVNEGDRPIHTKNEMLGQLITLKQKNLKAKDYASKTIQELFSNDILDQTLVREINTTSSVIAYNLGGGNFEIKPLPDQTQLSCIYSIECVDLNNDGTLEILSGGNNFEFKPQFSRQDAGFGNLISINNGKLQLKSPKESGFFIRDEIKHISTFKDNIKNVYIFVAINNQKPRVYSINE